MNIKISQYKVPKFFIVLNIIKVKSVKLHFNLGIGNYEMKSPFLIRNS